MAYWLLRAFTWARAFIVISLTTGTTANSGVRGTRKISSTVVPVACTRGKVTPSSTAFAPDFATVHQVEVVSEALGVIGSPVSVNEVIATSDASLPEIKAYKLSTLEVLSERNKR